MNFWVGILIGATTVMIINILLQWAQQLDYYSTPVMIASNFLAVVPVAIVCGIALCIFAPFYGLFRCLILGVPRERFEKFVAISDHPRTQLTKNIYFCRDPKSTKPWNRFFFVRIKKEKG